MSYTHTVVGIFDSDIDAQDAVDKLIEDGFNRSEIDIHNRRDVNADFESSDQEPEHHSYSEPKESGLTKFFKTIFGNNDEDAERHYRVAAAGGAIVTVYAKSEEAASRAADILDDKGAINVNERDAGYGPNAGTSTSGTSYPAANTGSSGRNDYDTSVLSTPDEEYVKTRNLDRQLDEDLRELPRVEERSGPGIGSESTGGQRSKSRINEWRGESSARLREDRDTETKIGW